MFVGLRLNSIARLGSGLVSALLLFLGLHAGESRAAEPKISPPAKPGLIVKFRGSVSAAEKQKALKNSSQVQTVSLSPLRQNAGVAAPAGLHLLSLSAGIDPSAELARLEGNPGVEYVEPNYPLRIFAVEPAPVFPNDFEFSKLYGLHNAGQNNGRTNADVNAPEAWAISTGSKAVIVAIVDTGIDYFHEDLRDNIWINPREVPGNGLDDDGNGYVDDNLGYDFVSGDNDPFDDNQHGTHVAGTVGAKGNNGLGTAGLCWEVSLMAVKAFDENGNATVADAIAGIRYAVQNGARIINASWGLDEKSRSLEEAALYAADAGVLMVAAAGNMRRELPTYPASFETVVSVGATDERDLRTDFSNFGPSVDLAAPGGNILSTFPEHSYGVLSGTSMAAPLVSGTAALVLSRHPELRRQDLYDILINSVDPIPFDQPMGNGRLNAAIAMRMDQPLPTARLRVSPTLSGVVEIAGTASGSFFTGFRVRAGAGRSPASWIDLASSAQPVTNGLLARFDTALLPDGAGVVQLIVSNQNGSAATARAPVQVLNARITHPLSGDIMAPGTFDIRGTVYGPGKTFRLEYGQGLNPVEWTEISSGESDAAVADRLLGTWHAAELPTGPYTLRLLVTTAGVQTEFTAPNIYLEEKLKAGWPVTLPLDEDFPVAEWRNARPADLDGDGTAEIVIIDPGTRSREQRLLVYSLQGVLLWSRALGFDVPPDLPAIGDIDGDGKQEIFADTTDGIAGFRSDGALLAPGWPIETATGHHGKVLADLDRDGRSELVAYSQEYAATQVAELRHLSVYRGDGTLVRQWQVPWCGFTNDVQKILPAVANLDDDPELEIAALSGCSDLAVFDYRQAEPKWRLSLASTCISSPVIGDVDGNGQLDIVVAGSAQNGQENGGIFIVTGQGQRWRGWPVLEEFSFVSSPALADLDSDGRLEIVLADHATLGARLHVVQWDGFEADGWPLEAFSKTSPRAGIALADVNGDGRTDVLVATPGYPGAALSQREPERLGGLVAWDFSGAAIPLNGAHPVTSIPFEASGHLWWHKSSPPALGDWDGNGRLDILVTTVQERTYGSLRRFKDRSSVYLWELNAPLSGPVPWAMFGHDPRNTGAYALPLVPTPLPTNVTRAIRDRLIIGEDRELWLRPLTNDLNAGTAPLSLLTTTEPSHGVLSRVGDTELRYLPGTNFSGLDQFRYVIADQAGALSTGTVLIRIKPLNDQPVAQDLSLTIKKNTSADIFYKAVDAETNQFTFRIVDPPRHGELWNYPAVGSYYPSRGYFGPDSFTYVASDGRQESFPATVSIDIVNSNNPPRAISASLLTKTNRATRVHLSAADPDGDLLTFEIVRKPVNGTVVEEGDTFRFIPDQDYLGPESFTFRAFDGTAFGDEATISISVIATNTPPRAAASSLSAQPNAESRVKLTGVDPDGDALTFTIATLPSHGTLLGQPPDLTYRPETNYLGPDRFTFRTSDGSVESAEAEFLIHVSRSNRPPVSENQIITVAHGTDTPLTLLGSDPDADELRLVLLKGPTKGLLYGAGTHFVYRPRPTAAGTDFFTYKLWDGRKFGNAARVTLSVEAPEQQRPPVFRSIQRGTNFVELVLTAPATGSVTVEFSGDLKTWEALPPAARPTESPFTVVDSNAPPGGRYYRARRNF